MTMPDERSRALVWAGGSLVELARNKGLPLDIRRRAVSIARHFPTIEQLDAMAISDPSWSGGIGLQIASLLKTGGTSVPWRLDPMARQAVCPICWEETTMGQDGQAELQCWTYVLRTRCPIHEAPLCLPLSRHHVGTGASKLVALSADDLKVLSLIENFGIALEQSLFFGASWPADWRCGVGAARRLLVEVTSSNGEAPGHPLIASVAPSEALTPFVHGGRHLLAKEGRQSWENFRRVADPAIRRAALWIVAWKLIPGLLQRMSPGWGMEFDDGSTATRAAKKRGSQYP